MGGFSWEYASETSPIINICPGDEIKMLIPEHFERDAIVGTYADYGIIEVGEKEYDIYDLLAIMNAESLSDNEEPQRRAKEFYNNKHLPTPKEVGDDEVRYIGINIESSGLEFPLKIVPPEEDVTYEKCEFVSERDYEQGSHRVFRDGRVPYDEDSLRVEDVGSKYAYEHFDETLKALEAMKMKYELEDEDYDAEIIGNMLENPEHTKAEIKRANIPAYFDYEEFIYEFVEEYRVVESKEDDILSDVFDEQDGMSL